MNRMRWVSLLASMSLAMAPLSASAQGVDCLHGEHPETHDACVASWVQTFYDETTSVEADFQQFFWTRVYDRTQSSRGRLRIARPGRIRFDYTEPSGKVVVGNGDQITYYEPGDDGASGQYYRGSTDVASRALGFLTGTSRLDRDFTFAIVESSAPVPDTICLELHPRAPDPHYTRVRLYVSSPAGPTRGVVRRVAIEDPDGNWNTFHFGAFHFNRDIEASVFDYTPPAGAREITPPSH